MTNSDPESSPTPSHSPRPRMRISIFVCLWTTLRCIYINWAAPTIDILFVCGLPSDVYVSIGPLRRLIYYLFVDYPPMNINWATPMNDIFNLDYPPIINVFRQPSEPFSLNSSHAFTPTVLGCSSAYGMHVGQFQYSLITCKYINMNILA